MSSAAAMLGNITSVSGSITGTVHRVGPTAGAGINWTPLLVLLLLVLSLLVLCQLGYLATRQRGALPAHRTPRLLYAVRFELGSAQAGVRITADHADLVQRLKADCPEPFRIILAADAVGNVTCQSEEILHAVEHLLATLSHPAAAPGLYAQLRQVRDLMRSHPFTRFQRIVDLPHDVPVLPVARLAPGAPKPERCQGRGFEVLPRGEHR